MSMAFQVSPRPPYKGRKPVQDIRRLIFVRGLPCIVCGTFRDVEAAHIGPHALSQKADDSKTLPICRWHHRISEYSLHLLGPVKFEQRYHLSLEKWLTEINEWYQREVANGSH